MLPDDGECDIIINAVDSIDLIYVQLEKNIPQ